MKMKIKKRPGLVRRRRRWWCRCYDTAGSNDHKGRHLHAGGKGRGILHTRWSIFDFLLTRPVPLSIVQEEEKEEGEGREETEEMPGWNSLGVEGKVPAKRYYGY